MAKKIDTWSLLAGLVVFALTLIATQWFSDNYHFERNKLKRNDDPEEDDTDTKEDAADQLRGLNV